MITRGYVIMRPHYQPPRDKQYFHTKPRIDKRDMAALKKKALVIQRKKQMIRYKEQFIKG
jgi:hypothetical protein